MKINTSSRRKSSPRKQLKSRTSVYKSPKSAKSGYRVLREIRRLQKSTNLLLLKLPFTRLIKEICQTMFDDTLRWKKLAIECLQEASEAYLIHMFETSYLCTIHAKRVTLMPQDMWLSRRLLGDENFD